MAVQQEPAHRAEQLLLPGLHSPELSCSWGHLALKSALGGDAPISLALAGPSAFQLVALWGVPSKAQQWEQVLCELCSIPVDFCWSVFVGKA